MSVTSAALQAFLSLAFWYMVAVAVGLLVAYALPFRRLWLVVAVVPVFLLFWIPLSNSVEAGVVFGLFLALYVLSWTAGVFAGRWLRTRRSRQHRQPPGAADIA